MRAPGSGEDLGGGGATRPGLCEASSVSSWLPISLAPS